MYIEAELEAFDVICVGQLVYYTGAAIHKRGEGQSQESTEDTEASELGHNVTGYWVIASGKLEGVSLTGTAHQRMNSCGREQRDN